MITGAVGEWYKKSRTTILDLYDNRWDLGRMAVQHTALISHSNQHELKFRGARYNEIGMTF